MIANILQSWPNQCELCLICGIASEWMGCRRIFGTAPASFFATTDSHHHVGLAVVAISPIVEATGWGCKIWTQSKSFYLDCIWITNYPQLSHDPLDYEKRDPRLWQDCKKIEMQILTIARHCGTIADTQALVLACPPFRAQTWPPAVRLGLIEDCSRIAPFFADCQQIGPIMSGLQKKHVRKIWFPIRWIVAGLDILLQLHCNRDWSICDGLIVLRTYKPEIFLEDHKHGK